MLEKKLGVLLEDGEATDCFYLSEMEEWEEYLRPGDCIKTYVPATEDDDTPPEQVVWVSWDDEEGWVAASYGGPEPGFDTWVRGPEGPVERPALKFVPESG